MKSRVLLTSSAVTLLGLALASPASALLDHYKCYKIKKDNIVFSQTASQVDQFGSNNAELKKAFLWCNPVNKNGEGIANNVDHLLCYKIKGLKLDPPPHISTTNQFGNSTLFAKKPFLLCVPGTKTIIP